MLKKTIKALLHILFNKYTFAIFFSINFIAAMHAYKFTHFDDTGRERTSKPEEIGILEAIKTVILGVKLPRPYNTSFPSQPFEKIYIQSNVMLECWKIHPDSSKGTVIIFHGYGGSKGGMIGQSDEFLKMGYSTILVDFMGAGGSEGNTCTIGYTEAENVKAIYDFISISTDKPIILFGTSMGAAAILRAVSRHGVHPSSIIVECPFGSMYKTTTARFQMMHIPSFPMGNLLVFWGGFLNQFWAFDHNPSEYAKHVKCPTLLLHGGKDQKVSQQEIDDIYQNLDCPKTKIKFDEAGHENYYLRFNNEWRGAIVNFLK
jgi:uncharacterized protein